jgi:hypothetical protein
MDRIVRYHSVQSGPFTDSNKVVDLKIPSGPSYDLDSSFVEIEASVDVAGNNIWDVQVKYNNIDRPIHNVALVRNSRLSSEYNGMIEEINAVDVLQSNLLHWNQSYSEKVSLSPTSLYQIHNADQNMWSPFRTFNTYNSQNSTNNNARLRIPLKQLMGLGYLKSFNSNKVGDMNLRLELNTDKIGAYVIGSPQEACNDIGAGAGDSAILTLTNNFANEQYPQLQQGGLYMVHGTGTGGKANVWVEQVINNIAIAGGGVTTVTFAANLGIGTAGGQGIEDIQIVKPYICENIIASQNTLTLSDASPQSVKGLFNGAMIRIIGEGAAPLGLDLYRRITNISVATTGVATITFSGNAIDGAAQNYTNVRIYIPLNEAAAGASPAATFNFNEVEVVMYQNAEMDDSDGYMFNSYEVEEQSTGAVSTYNNTFILNPECVNVYGLIDESGVASPYSFLDDWDSYRLKLDNKNLSQRNVEMGQPLYYDNMIRSMINSSLRARYFLGVPDSNTADRKIAMDNTLGGRNLKMLSNPVPMTANNKLLQVQANLTNATAFKLNLYKLVQKKL